MTVIVDIPLLGIQAIGMQAEVYLEMYVKIYVTVLFKNGPGLETLMMPTNGKMNCGCVCMYVFFFHRMEYHTTMKMSALW